MACDRGKVAVVDTENETVLWTDMTASGPAWPLKRSCQSHAAAEARESADPGSWQVRPVRAESTPCAKNVRDQLVCVISTLA